MLLRNRWMSPISPSKYGNNATGTGSLSTISKLRFKQNRFSKIPVKKLH